MATNRAVSTPYQFIKDGQLFIIPVGPQIDEVPYPTQPYTKPPDNSLWVNGRIQEPGLHLDHARMPPSMYQEIRNDLVRFSPVEVSRSAFQRSQHAYVGVIDSKGTPYYFALDSRGISVRPADANDERVWKTFDRLADHERAMAMGKRRERADEEMKQVAYELSEPLLVLMSKGLNSDDPSKRAATRYVIEMARAEREICDQLGESVLDPVDEDSEEVQKGRLPYGKRADWHYDAPGSSWWRHAAPKPERQAKQQKEPKAPKPPKPSAAERAAERTKVHLENYEARARGRAEIREKLRAEKKKNKVAKPKADDAALNAWKQKHPGGNVENMHAHPFAKGDRDARQSLKEEKRAVRDYGERGERARDPKLKRVFAHARKEEKQHVKMFKPFTKALPRKPKADDAPKKAKTGKASKKQMGAGGKTRYSYPGEKGGGKKPGAGQVPLVVVHQDHKHADPGEFANQLGVSVRTLMHAAKRLGQDGFVKFMRSHLKRFSAKHNLSPDYWGTLYERLQTMQAAVPS